MENGRNVEVYIKINDKDEIIDIASSIFIDKDDSYIKLDTLNKLEGRESGL